MAQRSKRYRKVITQIDRAKVYSLDEAVSLVKQTSTTKFDAGVEVHIKLGIDAKKGEEQIRGTVILPHGTGKVVRVAAFTTKPEEAKAAGADLAGGEELIKEIQTTQKTAFDVAVAEPGLMKALALVAKLLGSQGLMPSPKNETVTPDVPKAVVAFKQGKMAFKNDDTGNLHLLVGRVSFSEQDLKENIQAFLEVVRRSRPQAAKGIFIGSLTLSSSMGPGIRVSCKSLLAGGI